MTQTSEWLEAYVRAWETKAEGDIRAIFTDDAEYWFRPNDAEPVRGIDAMIESWREPEPTEPVHDLAVLIENDELGIIKGTVSYPGHADYTNLWEVWFASDGRARKFVEWWMLPREMQPGV
ncbi:nuclear transport factor 2 family protein [Demequina sp. NBRC 110057]|uniref:nuclear transport factor 2 family protein n=1 Tax=Demequina sp. NBRC 110057 TaxID=1570346 RepID=UPI00117765BA|nr:nuclear transport factor 2 family protein [Demequina sp. NBRC 110057]